MPLFESYPIDSAIIARVVSEHFSIKLGDVVKASQNHTFSGEFESDGSRFAVRVTPDPYHSESLYQRIRDEVQFLTFLEASGLEGVCSPVKSLRTDELCVRESSVIVVVTRWAPGALINFLDYSSWLRIDEIPFNWGAWMGRFHNASAEFSKRHAEVVARVQKWDEIHQGMLKGFDIVEEDRLALIDSAACGVLHGDLNISNFHYLSGRLFVFDWDQIQTGWWEMDIAQACITPFTLHEGGAVITGEPVPQAEEPLKFVHTFVSGYNSTCKRPADWDRLLRMINLRRSFYFLFAERALREEGDTIPAGMRVFLDYVQAWADKYRALDKQP
jgi:Ser/Thr protein kinase RdoA (MazF antagonist)